MRSLRTCLTWTALVFLPVLALMALGAPVAHAHAPHLSHALGFLPLVGMATNTLGNYNETFFAQEALIQLEKVLGMAGRVYRDYNEDPQVRGSTIQVRRPSTFSAQSAPSSDQNVTTDSVAIVLDQWDEVKFSITDKDLTLSSERLITDHIRPAAVALADKIDQNLAALYKLIPWYTTMSATPALADITAIQKIMFDNKVPMTDQMNLHFMIGGAEQAAFQNAMTQLSNPQASGLRDGSLGRLYGYDTWANQNAPKHTSGTAADAVGALTADTVVGASTIALDSITTAGTVKVGDIVTIAGDAQQYVVTADATASGGAITSLAVSPTIKAVSVSTTVVTLHLGGAAKTQNLAFHRNAFCLAFAPLSEMGNQLGARIATISDPITSLSLRSRLFYDGDNSRVKVALDALYGVKVLDPNLAVRGFAA